MPRLRIPPHPWRSGHPASCVACPTPPRLHRQPASQPASQSVPSPGVSGAPRDCQSGPGSHSPVAEGDAIRGRPCRMARVGTGVGAGTARGAGRRHRGDAPAGARGGGGGRRVTPFHLGADREFGLWVRHRTVTTLASRRHCGKHVPMRTHHVIPMVAGALLAVTACTAQPADSGTDKPGPAASSSSPRPPAHRSRAARAPEERLPRHGRALTCRN